MFRLRARSGLPSALVRAADLHAWNCQNIEEFNIAMARWVRAEIAPRETIAATDGGAIRYFGEYQVLDLIGLNNRRLLHGERSGPAALAAVDPVVSFPALFSKLGRSDTWWPVPRTATAHLTIWDCPQSELVAFHRVP